MKSLECLAIEELLGGYVLSALPDQERSAVERHLANCAKHVDVIKELTRSSSLLGLAAMAREPRPELRTKVLAAIRAASEAATVPLGWGTERLPVGSHVCAFHADDGRLRRTMAFLQAGFEQSEDFGVLFADRRRFETLLGWLQEDYDGSVENLIDRGKLALIDGAPRVEQILERIARRLDRAIRDGYGLIRFLGFIGWDQPNWPDLASLVEFEKAVNQVVRAYPAVVVCTYDLVRLPGLSLFDGGLRSHPITILGDQVVRQNPFYKAA